MFKVFISVFFSFLEIFISLKSIQKMKKLNLFIYLFVGLLLVVSLNGYVVRDDVDEDDDDYNGINRPPSQDSVGCNFVKVIKMSLE